MASSWPWRAPTRFELLAVTTVAGNVPLARTQRNARQILELAGRRDVPVHAGCDRPMVRPLETAEYVHGETGLNGAELPEPSLPLGPRPRRRRDRRAGHGPARGQRHLVPDRAAHQRGARHAEGAADAPRLRGIVLMGGAMGLGNVTPAAEFNVYVDPHAASVVFGAGVPLVMLGLDVTHQALVTRERLDRFAAMGTAVGRACFGMLDFFNRFDMARYRAEGAPLHDPCVIAYLLRPDLFRGRDCLVEIETEGRSAGRTNVHWWPRQPVTPNATVIGDMDAAGFFDLLFERLGRL